ncbi:hypothetical protein Ahy_B10g102009 [Arachis hypogaea]|uniref:Reverse transcriptase zinc-binding domain-containing protein n=1 Tax=Arachis hypogaea TaxID=3818 RepID=A0A444X0X0_ARAHY|nr:hypothetical protein Ahy_B10g102009 [Arachis hypogaea]
MNKLEEWKEKLLNHVGKKTLIKSIIQAMSSYVMNIIKFSKSFCKKICAKVAWFWWATPRIEQGIHWSNWDTITRSKIDGGYGLRTLKHRVLPILPNKLERL